MDWSWIYRCCIPFKQRKTNSEPQSSISSRSESEISTSWSAPTQHEVGISVVWREVLLKNAYNVASGANISWPWWPCFFCFCSLPTTIPRFSGILLENGNELQRNFGFGFPLKCFPPVSACIRKQGANNVGLLSLRNIYIYINKGMAKQFKHYMSYQSCNSRVIVGPLFAILLELCLAEIEPSFSIQVLKDVMEVLHVEPPSFALHGRFKNSSPMNMIHLCRGSQKYWLEISTKQPMGDSSKSPRTRGRYVSKSEWEMQKDDRSGNSVLSGRFALAHSRKVSMGRCNLMIPYMHATHGRFPKHQYTCMGPTLFEKTYSHQESLYLPFNPTQLPARIHGHSHCRTPANFFFELGAYKGLTTW